MSKEREIKKQQMTFIVSLFLAVIIIAWIASFGWSLYSANEKEGDGSVKSLVGGIEEGIASFSANMVDKDIDFKSVISSLTDRFDKEQAVVDSVTDAMLEKLTEAKMDSWSVYQDEQIYFKHPIEWSLIVDGNVLRLQYEDNNVIDINIYKNLGELPDNINGLELVAWMDEQIDRELGVFTAYELSDFNETIEMYSVARKDSDESVDLYWQLDDSAYHLGYNSNERIDKIIKLIISTIK